MIPLLLTNKQNSNIKVLNENNHAGYRLGNLLSANSTTRAVKGRTQPPSPQSASRQLPSGSGAVSCRAGHVQRVLSNVKKANSRHGGCSIRWKRVSGLATRENDTYFVICEAFIALKMLILNTMRITYPHGHRSVNLGQDGLRAFGLFSSSRLCIAQTSLTLHSLAASVDRLPAH